MKVHRCIQPEYHRLFEQKIDILNELCLCEYLPSVLTTIRVRVTNLPVVFGARRTI